MRKKRESTDWLKIFVRHISDGGLVSNIYTELSKLKTLRTKMGSLYEQKLHQRAQTDGKDTYEEILNILFPQGIESYHDTLIRTMKILVVGIKESTYCKENWMWYINNES